MECEKISQHGEISESSKTSKNQKLATYVEIFSNNREQQKAKIQT